MLGVDLAFRGMAPPLVASSLLLGGLPLAFENPPPPAVDESRGTGRVYYEWVDRTPRQIKRRREEEALLLGKAYLT